MGASGYTKTYLACLFESLLSLSMRDILAFSCCSKNSKPTSQLRLHFIAYVLHMNRFQSLAKTLSVILRPCVYHPVLFIIFINIYLLAISTSSKPQISFFLAAIWWNGHQLWTVLGKVHSFFQLWFQYVLQVTDDFLKVSLPHLFINKRTSISTVNDENKVYRHRRQKSNFLRSRK